MVQQADVCIICALEEEADAVEQVIRERCQVIFLTHATDDGRFAYRSTTIINTKQEPLTLAVIRQTRPGPVSAALDLGTLREKFQPGFVGMSGICAGDKRHLHLGDLVVAEYAYHFEEGKVMRDGQGMVVHQPEGITYSPTEHVLQYVRTFATWKTPVVELKKCLIGTEEVPRCIMTLMASGMAVRSDNPFPVLQQLHRKTWALDMEAASFYLALRATPGLDGLVVKGVCDYADHDKDDTYHEFAARASAMYLLTFIQEYVTWETLRRSRSLAKPVSAYNALFIEHETLLIQSHSDFQTRQATATSQTKLPGENTSSVADTFPPQRPATRERPLRSRGYLRGPLRRQFIISSITLALLIVFASIAVFIYISKSMPDIHPAATSTATPVPISTVTPAPTSTATPVPISTIDATKLTPAQLYNAVTSLPTFYSSNLSEQDYAQWEQLIFQPGGSCSFVRGAYVFTAAQIGGVAACFEQSSFSDFAFQAQMTILSGGNRDGGGLVFRATSRTVMYRFRVSLDGSYDVTSTGLSGTSSAIKQGLNQKNLLTVIAQGNQLFFYVNKQYIDHTSSSFSNQGKIGFMAFDSSEPIQVAFTDAQVWQL